TIRRAPSASGSEPAPEAGRGRTPGPGLSAAATAPIRHRRVLAGEFIVRGGGRLEENRRTGMKIQEPGIKNRESKNENRLFSQVGQPPLKSARSAADLFYAQPITPLLSAGSPPRELALFSPSLSSCRASAERWVSAALRGGDA